MKTIKSILVALLITIGPLGGMAQIGSLGWYGNSLQLRNDSGKVLAEYSSKLGKPDSWTEAGSQKYLLFFKSYQRVEFLDNKLNRIGDAIFLPDVGVYKSTLVCPSADNGIWVYDDAERKIFFVDFALRKRTSSLELTAILAGVKGNPMEMKEMGGRLYLIYKQITLVLDRYGNLVKMLQNKNN